MYTNDVFIHMIYIIYIYYMYDIYVYRMYMINISCAGGRVGGV